MSNTPIPENQAVAPVAPAATESTPEQIAAVKAFMEELHKKTVEATQGQAKLPQGLVNDTVKLG